MPGSAPRPGNAAGPENVRPSRGKSAGLRSAPLTAERSRVRDHVRTGTEAVDGLRGIAILLVVFYHTWLFSWFTPALRTFGYDVPVDVVPRNGYLGVDLFFAISGFVLYLPYARRALAGDGRAPSLGDYAFRRFIKIVPSYAIVLVATFFFSIEYLAKPDLWKNLAVHAVFLQNAYPDGFGTANSVFWSLATEAQFYVVFPLAAWAFDRAPLPAALGMAGIALAYRYGVAGCCVGVQTVTRQMPAYLDLFGGGMLAAYAVAWVRLRRPALGAGWTVAATFGAAACVAATWLLFASADRVQYVPLGAQHWDVGNRTLLAAAFCGLLATSCLAARWWRALLANPLLTFLSIVSYNVYLWHTLLMIWMWKHDVPHAATKNPHDDDHWKLVYIASGWAVTLLVSTAVTYFIERPLLGFVKPQPFAFDWRRFARRAALTPGSSAAPSERRT
jgi:peptidoglycan/LPS O-acetylase OafA/YrhL